MSVDEPQQVVHVEETEPEDTASGRDRRVVPRIVFAVVSLAFLAFLAIGTVDARIWRFGRLYFEERDVRHVWTYVGDRLPDLPAQGIFAGLFWISVAVMVIGTVLGLWLFLGTEDEDPAADVTVDTTSHLTPHA